jgi:major outer membrane protein
VDDYKQDTNSGTVTLNILDRMDLYGVFGSSRVCSDWRFTAENMTVNRVEMETSYRFLWAVGARVLIFEWGCTNLGIGGRYNATHLKPTWTTINGLPIPTTGTRLQWREWQIDMDISYPIEIFIPYLGVKYSNARSKIGSYSEAISSSGSGSLHMKNRNLVGLVIGCTLTTEKYFMLNIEGRLIDEQAATIVGDFRF